MSVNYSQTAITDRLNGVITAIDDSGAGNLLILSGGTTLATIALANPCGNASGGVLTFFGPLTTTATTTGSANAALIQDGGGNTMISGLTVGIPLSGADIILSNGLNSTLITIGQTVELLSAQITGS
jgi:hypothetical protein